MGKKSSTGLSVLEAPSSPTREVMSDPKHLSEPRLSCACFMVRITWLPDETGVPDKRGLVQVASGLDL